MINATTCASFRIMNKDTAVVCETSIFLFKFSVTKTEIKRKKQVRFTGTVDQFDEERNNN